MQRRIAVAAEGSACVSQVQLWWSTLGILLVLGSLWFTAWAALAASKAANVAEKALSLERPIVFDDHFQATRRTNSAGGAELVFQMIYKNGGNSPALNLRSNGNFAVRTSDIPDDFDYRDTVFDLNIGTSKLAPRQEHEMTIVISVDLAAGIYAGPNVMFFYGWIEYDDVFERAPRHRTEFCYKILVTADPHTPGPCLRAHPYGIRYNGMDDNCLYSPDNPAPQMSARRARGVRRG